MTYYVIISHYESLDNFITINGAIDRVAWKRQSTEERRVGDVMLRQGKAHERRDAEAKHSRERAA